jgi:competence protein ComEA
MNHGVAAAVSVPAALVLFTISAAMQDRFPDGPGKAEFARVCGACHEAEVVLEHPQTAGDWSGTLERMSQAGADASAAEWRLIEQYLDAELALVNINEAPYEELQRTFAIDEALAKAIVKMRQDKGKFTSIDDVKKVPGLDAAKVDARKDRLTFATTRP